MSDLLFKQITSSASKLITEFDTSQSEIQRKISDLLLIRSKKLPPLQIAINSGGDYYDYSDGFLEWILQQDSDHDVGDATLGCVASNNWITYSDKKSRIEIVPYIKRFGKVISDKYPGILEIIMLYLQADFHKLGGYIVQLNSLWNQKEILSENLEIISNHIDNVKKFGTETGMIDLDSKITGTQLEKYTRIHLEKTEKKLKDALDAKKSLISQAEDHANEIPLEFLADIIEKIETKLPEQLQIERRLIEIERYKKLRGMDFLRNVELSGSDSWSIWHSQKQIQPSIAIYLMKNRKIVDKFVNLSQKAHHVLQAQTLLGLISASNANCTLEIVEIPQLVEWKLIFDGKCERVITL